MMNINDQKIHEEKSLTSAKFQKIHSSTIFLMNLYWTYIFYIWFGVIFFRMDRLRSSISCCHLSSLDLSNEIAKRQINCKSWDLRISSRRLQTQNQFHWLNVEKLSDYLRDGFSFNVNYLTDRFFSLLIV